mgnify:CR=1 FL=1|jgi:hypothetical protein
MRKPEFLTSAQAVAGSKREVPSSGLHVCRILESAKAGHVVAVFLRHGHGAIVTP